MNTFKIIYLKKGNFYLKNKQNLEEISLDYLENMEYQLLIDDSYFFYESIDMPATNKKKQFAIIKNFLLVNYPEELISHFNFINIKQLVLIYIITEKLFQLVENYKEIFSNANKISTPFIESLHMFDNFNYKIDNMTYQIINNQIQHIAATDDEIKTADDIIEKLDELNENLNIIKKDRSFAIAKSMQIPITIILISYIIFIVGDILRVNAIKKYLNKHENLLVEIYRSAGVIDSNDPYGSLISKTRNTTKLNNRLVLLNIEYISKSIDNQTIIDSLNIRKDSVRFDGITKDYSSLESFTTKLKEYTKKNVSILNTKKEEEHISFSLRIG